MNTIEKHSAFLDSLEGEKGLPDEIHRLLVPGVDSWQPGDEYLELTFGGYQSKKWVKLGPTYKSDSMKVLPTEIGRRLIGTIPDLKEKVKEFARDAMDMVRGYDESDSEFKAFCALCAEVKP